MTVTIWQRAEVKPREARCALTPADAGELIAKGFQVVVEKSDRRVFADRVFAEHGCEMAQTGAWRRAPSDAYILGVKDLPDEAAPLGHRHIYFGHVYKGQSGARRLLSRFVAGGGELLDIEYLLDDDGKRVAAFGYWAGFAGCAVGLKTWCGQQLELHPAVPALTSFSGKDALLSNLSEQLERAAAVAGRAPTVMIIGALGRVGSGAGDLADTLGLRVTRWDMAETAGGGPFRELLAHDLFVNCVLVNRRIPPFVTRESLMENGGRRLSVISDVSCDPGANNPIPLYTQATTFERPTIRVLDGPPALDLTAIDHLPSLLPAEASEDFSRQLMPHLADLHDPASPVWDRARRTFREHTQGIG